MRLDIKIKRLFICQITKPCSAGVHHHSTTLVHRPVGRCVCLQFLETFSFRLWNTNIDRRYLSLPVSGKSKVSHVTGSYGGCVESFQDDL